MEAITTFTAPYVALPMENVDTDQIIPARFLKTTNKAGLGDNLFADWRYAADGLGLFDECSCCCYTRFSGCPPRFAYLAV